MTPTREAILEALKEVYDPEIPVDIVNLGLVYDAAVDGGRVTVTMTMTSPGCPVGDFLAQEVERVIRALGDVDTVRVQLVWDPPWSPEKMSAEGRKILGW
jgi:metal-sulfur cluster biosynthetic enzyme